MKRQIVVSILIMIIVSMLLSACSAAASTASCAYVVGNGQNGHDTKVSKIIYPGEQVVYDSGSQNVWYVPCNSRNFLVNDGTELNANDKRIGDSFKLLMATTKTGVPIAISATAFWTLNQSEQAMKDFYNVCFKYTCASADDKGGGANFSTQGWNGMLGENFGQALNWAAKSAAEVADDSIWQKPTTEQYAALGDSMAAVFPDIIRARLGYPEDLFCGSGNSQWEDPDNPGKGTFYCSPVRIVVESVKLGTILPSDTSEGAQTINKQRLANAQELYGVDAGYWLGLQDTVGLCRDNTTTCVFNIGNVSNTAVAVPVNNPVVVPTLEPTPTPKP